MEKIPGMEKARLALCRLGSVPQGGRGSGILGDIVREYYVEIRNARIMRHSWRRIAGDITSNTGIRMTGAGLSRVFRVYDVDQCRKAGIEPLPGPDAPLRPRKRRKKEAMK